MRFIPVHLAPLAVLATLGLTACNLGPDGVASNPRGNAAERTIDRAAGTDMSGAYPSQRDGTRNNPPGTAVQRGYDRATGSDTSGAFPAQRNLPGNAAERAYDRTTGSDTSGAYPQNR
jgi:hypothetical protein